ncbi:MAG: M23 family peptidase, partial [Rhizobiales bacterium]|nr:M23 family peptidase [Hyphomicrobiales bacterium]
MLLATPATAAEDFKTPAISAVHVEWRAALDQFKSEIAAHPDLASRFTFTSRRRLSASDPRVMPAFEQLNAITSPLFSGISRSPIPVLLPFDTAGYVKDQDNGAPGSIAISHYQSGFNKAEMFVTGGAGYDALFSLPRASDGSTPERVYAKPVEV